MRLGQNYQLLAFFALVVVFEILERLRPMREVNRWKDLKIDLLSFACAGVINQSCKLILGAAFAEALPDWMASGFAALQSWPSWVRICVAVVIVDGVIYWIHRSQHKFDLLWRTHAWHHSIEELYWFSGFRTSFFHSFLNAIPATTVSLLVFNLTPFEAGIGYSIGMLVQFWEHTNLRTNIGWLKYIIITPDYHRVHHATYHTRSNFGTTFSFWDRMFGTYKDPSTVPLTEPLGLGEPIEAKQMPKLLIGI